MSTQQQQLDYIERHLVDDLLKCFSKDACLISHSVECSNGLDGFMSALYTVQLNLKIADRCQKETVLVKFMKGAPEFREGSKSYAQFANEVFAYADILPAYQQLLRDSHLETDVISGWVPHAYRAEFGVIEGGSSDIYDAAQVISSLIFSFLGLGSDRESVLALKHLKGDGYELGPRLILRTDQLKAMCALVGPLHALGYATRILRPEVYQRLRSGIIPLTFVAEQESTPNIYDAVYRAAFVRFYEFYDRQKEQLLGEEDTGLAAALERLRKKYFAHPNQLLEHMRTTSCDESQSDSYFSTILHGDFNRNNVLFHYGVDGQVDNIKMIDFQELRYTTTAIDLSFFMYMNTLSADCDVIFPVLLRHYHKHMYDMLELVLQNNKDTLTEEQIKQHLSNYSFERFQAHFKRYAFYGVMVCMHFMPWLLGSEEECAKISHLFETDMHGPEFFQLSIDIAGDEANQEIFRKVRHAYEQGYLDEI